MMYCCTVRVIRAALMALALRRVHMFAFRSTRMSVCALVVGELMQHLLCIIYSYCKYTMLD